MADDVRWGTAATQVDGLLRDADEGWSGCGHTDKVVGSQVAVVPGCWMGERRPFWPLAFGWSIRVTLLFRHQANPVVQKELYSTPPAHHWAGLATVGHRGIIGPGIAGGRPEG